MLAGGYVTYHYCIFIYFWPEEMGEKYRELVPIYTILFLIGDIMNVMIGCSRHNITKSQQRGRGDLGRPGLAIPRHSSPAVIPTASPLFSLHDDPRRREEREQERQLERTA